MLTITVSFIKQLSLPIEQLSQNLNIEVTREGKVPYFGHVEVNLPIPDV